VLDGLGLASAVGEGLGSVELATLGETLLVVGSGEDGLGLGLGSADVLVGSGVGLPVGLGLAVPVGVGLAVPVGVGVAVPVGPGVAVPVGPGVAVPVGPGVGVVPWVGVEVPGKVTNGGSGVPGAPDAGTSPKIRVAA
jgi:hypothetical protein